MNRRIFSERGYDIKGKVLPIDKLRLFRNAENGFTISEEMKKNMIRRAERSLSEEFPALIASDYMMFKRDGNRSVYEGKYFPRRGALIAFLSGEYAEGKGRFIDKIIDLTWLILEETSWVVPAHNPPKLGVPQILPFAYSGKVDYIDLFSACTAADLAWVYYLIKDKLDEVSPLICERIKYELDRRIVDPFLDPSCKEKQWWTGDNGNKVNNWNPWIISNVLVVCALTVDDNDTRERIVELAMQRLDNFTSTYHDDGGCDEGPSYWGAAGASLFDCLELLYDLTDGYVNLYDDPLVKNMGEYEVKVCVNGNRFLNFADCSSKLSPNPAILLRWGKCCNSEMMYTYGASRLEGKLPSAGIDSNHSYRYYRNLVEVVHEPMEFVAPTKIWLDGIIIAGTRETSATDKGLYLAFKGGHNDENHNHNDVGNIIVFADGNPIFLDVGSGRYTRRTFSPERYTIWAMCSDHHNCATVNGVDQLPGKQYASCDHVYDGETGALSLQLKNAYPENAKISSYIRKAELKDGLITVNDSIELLEDGTIAFNFICNTKPENVTETSFELYGRTVSFSELLEYSEEILDVSWPEFERTLTNWDCEALYRVKLTAKKPFKAASFTLTVK